MADLLSSAANIQWSLDALARRCQVPGAALAIFDGEHLLDFVTGIANRDTNVEVNRETLFQIGSITKIFTTTLVMQLVEQGKVDLDRPVKDYVPGFAMRDPHATGEITPRTLLNHSSGIVGDHFADFGAGEDCIERYVASLREFEQVHVPGMMFSYCNAGFSVAGRLIECVGGSYYHEALARQLLEPLGLKRTSVLADEMLRFRYSVGHTAVPEA